MEVSLAVLADYVVVSHDQKLSILGIFNNINGVQAPGSFPNCFVVIVNGACGCRSEPGA